LFDLLVGSALSEIFEKGKRGQKEKGDRFIFNEKGDIRRKRKKGTDLFFDQKGSGLSTV